MALDPQNGEVNITRCHNEYVCADLDRIEFIAKEKGIVRKMDRKHYHVKPHLGLFFFLFFCSLCEVMLV